MTVLSFVRRNELAFIANAALLLFFSATAMSAQLPPWHSNIDHTGWTKKDGAPANVSSMAQDSRGLLWFAGNDGLYQFDGVKFQRSDAIDGNKLLSPGIASVAAFGDALWLAYSFGGVSVFEHGAVRHYGEKDGVPEKSVLQFGQMPSGLMWISTGVGMFWREGERWHQAGAQQGLPTSENNSFNILPDGSMLTYFEDGVYQSAPNSHQFHRVIDEVGVESGELRPDGTLLITSKRQGLQSFNPATGQLKPFTPYRSADLPLAYISDRRGALWINTSAGIELLGQTYRPQKTYTLAQGLTGKLLMANLDDREGNLWMATENGIDRFRETRLNTLDLPAGLSQSLGIVAGAEGAVWISNSMTSAAFRVPVFGVAADGQRLSSPMLDISSSYRAPGGDVWFAGRTTLWRQRGEQRRQWPLPPALRGHDVQAMAMDADGTLWLSIAGVGSYTFTDGQWLAGGGHADLAHPTAISLFADTRGRVWFGYPGNRLAMLEGGKLRLFDAAAGLAIGNILAMHERSGTLWIGGDRGLAWFDGQRFIALGDSDGAPFRGVSGIVETKAGELWLHDADGLIRIGASDLAIAVHAGVAARVPAERFDYLDGHEGVPAHIRPLPTLVEASDGRLWYATSSSIGSIDPAHIARNTRVPTVIVTRLVADGRAYLPGKALKLPPHTENLQIDFTTAILSMPQRARFRYRLSGLETSWRDADGLRQAFYTNLGPGDYRFEVMAANEDGLWSTHAATQPFRIAPGPMQTLWFKLACGLAALLALYLLYLLRVAQVTARLTERLQERTLERARIARTLHDTFLQSVQALILRIHTIKTALPADVAIHQQIEHALLAADDVLQEGRDQVMDLRDIDTAREPQEDLRLALAGIGRTLAAQYGTSFALTCSGHDALMPAVRDEVFAIGREALLNAFRHSGSTGTTGTSASITVELDYAASAFRMTVRDHGQGISETVLAAGHRQGHWGLTGMRERAARVGGALEIGNPADGGTEVSLRIAARQAYTSAPGQQRLARRLWTGIGQRLKQFNSAARPTA